MRKNTIKSVGVYATYSDIYGNKYGKEKLISLIRELPFGGVITILSQLNSLQIENNNIIEGFYEFLEREIPEASEASEASSYIRNKLKDRLLYTPQGLLSVWKWILTYGDIEKINKEIDLENGIFKILYLNLIVSDYLVEKKDSDVLYDFFSNINFNSKKDAGAKLTRACIMYDEIARKSQLFNKKEYIDINFEFLNKYGYTIKEYLAIIFAIHTSFIVNDGIIKPSGAQNLDSFSNFLHKDKFEAILEELSVSIEDAREWSHANINNSWNYQLFRERPLIRIENGLYLSINHEFLFDKVFNQLFFKIRDCFSKDSEQIISFIGRCFENYIDIITTEAGEVSSIPYEIISEFNFGGNRSPDCMIKLGNKLVAIEAKNRRLKLDSLINSKPETIHFDLTKMIKEPIIQLHNCMKKLSDRNHTILDGVEEIYLIVVTQGSIATLPPFMLEINESLEKSFELPIKSYYHLDIEEYEWLLAIIAKKDSRPIFRILDNKTKLAPLTSFHDFALKQLYSKKRLDFIDTKLMQHTDDFGKILAGERWISD